MPEIIAKIKSAQKLMAQNDRLLLANKVTGEMIPLTCKKKIEFCEVVCHYNDSYVGLDSVSCEIQANGCHTIVFLNSFQ